MGREKGSDRPGGPTDPDEGLWQGRSIARRFTSEDGFTVLVGRTAKDNDLLSIRLSSPKDFWFHVAGQPGSHVVVRNPDGVDRLPRETEQFAAALAAGYSSQKKGGRVAVHAASCSDVTKPRGLAAGKVQLKRFKTLKVTPRRGE
jgi:predicted ribosome quality control (RQC) complex YloA/Tae2 family protein